MIDNTLYKEIDAVKKQICTYILPKKPTRHGALIQDANPSWILYYDSQMAVDLIQGTKEILWY